MSGFKIAIDPGHGGRDPGAIGFIREVDIVYPWSSRFVQELQRRGFDAVLTHKRPAPDKKISLRKRVQAANSMEADLFFSIHADAWKAKGPGGASAFVYRKGSEAYRIAQAILPALQRGIGAHGGVKIANFHVLRRTHMPAILLEIGFVTNPDDTLWIMEHYKSQAASVAEALDSYLT